MAMKTRGKSILMTPDPYHTPGYGGFCPQFKYRIGETFGRTTAQLLTDASVASSGKLVLGRIQPTTEGRDGGVSDDRLQLLRTRTHSWGDQKLGERMVPGYTGFIPKGQHYFGKRYAINSVNAVSDFENDQRKYNRKMEDLRLTEALQTGAIEAKPEDQLKLPQISTKYRTPLKPITKEVPQYFSPHVHHHSMSPHYMSNTDPEKRFMSGYTGFVPQSRGYIGMGYPIITNAALNDFTDATKRYRQVSAQPVTLSREEVFTVNTKPIYPKESGLVPHYTGHIPGQKFRFGLTFGHSTKDTLGNSPPEVTVSI